MPVPAEAPGAARRGFGRGALGRRARLAAGPLLTGALAIAIFELVHRSGLLSTLIIPSPFSVLLAMWQQALTAHMWSNMWITVQESLWAFFIGSAIGLLFGIAIGMSRTASRALYPYIILVQSMPRVALAPVFVALLGFGQQPKVLTAIAICFFPVLINAIVGLRHVDEDSIMLMRTLCASRSQMFWKLLLPGAMPMIFGGLKTNMTLAFLGAIVGELTAANAGVGLLIEASAFQLRMDAVFAYIMWLSLVSLAAFGVLELIDRRVVFWKAEARRNVFGAEEDTP